MRTSTSGLEPLSVEKRRFPIKHLSEEELKARFSTMHRSYPVLSQNIMSQPHGIWNYDGNIDWAKKLDYPFDNVAATVSPIL